MSGECPVCGRRITVRPDGIGWHRALGYHKYRPACRGWYQPPKPDSILPVEANP